jgi:predicted ArsR family transcriptional regulator
VVFNTVVTRRPVPDGEGGGVTGPRRRGEAGSSRRAIQAVLEGSPHGMTVAELSGALGVHPNAVRKQLRALMAEGALGAERVRSGGRGRPFVRYRAAAAGRDTAAVRRLATMLVELLAGLGPDEAAVEEFGRRQAPLLATGDGRTALLDAITAMGFAPRETTPPGGARAGRLELVLGNCPFRDAAAAAGGGLVCVLHRGISRGLVELTPSGRLTAFEARPPREAGCRIAAGGLPAPRPPG